MKPKRLLTVRHADGRTEYICQKCGSVMEWHTIGGMHYSAGVVWDDIEEVLTCPNCGNDVVDYPKMTARDFRVSAGA